MMLVGLVASYPPVNFQLVPEKVSTPEGIGHGSPRLYSVSSKMTSSSTGAPSGRRATPYTRRQGPTTRNKTTVQPSSLIAAVRQYTRNSTRKRASKWSVTATSTVSPVSSWDDGGACGDEASKTDLTTQRLPRARSLAKAETLLAQTAVGIKTTCSILTTCGNPRAEATRRSPCSVFSGWEEEAFWHAHYRVPPRPRRRFQTAVMPGSWLLSARNQVCFIVMKDHV
jgi:hypothetical protein